MLWSGVWTTIPLMLKCGEHREERTVFYRGMEQSTGAKRTPGKPPPTASWYSPIDGAPGTAGDAPKY